MNRYLLKTCVLGGHGLPYTAIVATGFQEHDPLLLELDTVPMIDISSLVATMRKQPPVTSLALAAPIGAVGPLVVQDDIQCHFTCRTAVGLMLLKEMRASNKE